MQRDAKLMRIPFALHPDELHAQLQQLVDANDAANATLRVAVVRNKGGAWESPGQEREVDVIAFTADLRAWEAGVNLGYKPNARFAASPFAGTKVTSWAQNLTWYEEAHEEGFDEFILLNEEGEISECTSANIFVIQGDRVWTPPIQSSGCLPGVTRALLVEEIQVAGLQIGERDLTPSDLEDSDQIFITSSTRDLIPVLTIEGEPMKQSQERMEVLRAAFEAYQAAYVRRHAVTKVQVPA
jgi:branched-chain amino acid aminotransferase